MICALIKNNIVENLIVADAETDVAPDGYILVNTSSPLVGIGTEYDPDAGEFLIVPKPPSPVVVPSSVTPRQVRLLLLQQGLLEQVEAIIAAQDEATKITWQYASVFERDNPLLNDLAQTLVLSPAQLDEFFIAAAAL